MADRTKSGPTPRRATRAEFVAAERAAARNRGRAIYACELAVDEARDCGAPAAGFANARIGHGPWKQFYYCIDHRQALIDDLVGTGLFEVSS